MADVNVLIEAIMAGDSDRAQMVSRLQAETQLAYLKTRYVEECRRYYLHEDVDGRALLDWYEGQIVALNFVLGNKMGNISDDLAAVRDEYMFQSVCRNVDKAVNGASR